MGIIAAAALLALLTAGAAQAQTSTNTNGNTNTNNLHAKATATASSSLNATIVSNVSTGGDNGAPSIGFSAAGLAGLPDGGGCVLATTKSIQAGISIAGFGGQGAYADGATSPYYECNAKQTLAIYSAMAPGSIVCRHVNPASDCHTAQEIAGRIAAHLTGVDAAFDELDGKTSPPQTSAVPQTTPVQTASAASGSDYIGPANAPTVTKMAAQGTNK